MKTFKLINTTVSIRSLIKRKNDVEVATSKGDDKYPVAFFCSDKAFESQTAGPWRPRLKTSLNFRAFQFSLN